MDLYQFINRRKSSRDYTQELFSAEELASFEGVINEFAPLYADVPLKYRFTTKTKGLYNVKAPLYLVVSGEGNEREIESAGFLVEHFVLWLDSQDFGSVFLGSSKDVDKNLSGKDLIVLAFGTTEGPVHRDISAFKRKPIEDITNAPEDACIQAVHLAPSGMNIQPWYLEKTDTGVLLYEKILKGPLALAYSKIDIDMGIALCHYSLACKHIGRPFSFARKERESSKKGYRLFGEITE